MIKRDFNVLTEYQFDKLLFQINSCQGLDLEYWYSKPDQPFMIDRVELHVDGDIPLIAQWNKKIELYIVESIVGLIKDKTKGL